MITQESIEEVKDRASLIDLIGESTNLKRAGANYLGLCPFHNEKSGSFHIRENGKFYHCFGCGASGNAISYYMHTRGVSFPQAVEELAERFSVTLKYTGNNQKEKPREDKTVYYEINKTAVEFYRKALKNAPAVVKEYIKKRQLKEETLEAFSIGFSLPAWNSLSEHLKSKKISEEHIVTSGLARRNSKGDLYDMFRARLIFPIFSDNKKAAAFGGRLIPDLVDKESAAQSPKYLNSPDNPVYQKNKILFGLPQAFNAIRENGFVYIVEGYMDVVSLWQAGVKNVLATCGTALSQGHIKRLAYLCKRAYVLFDGDNAGRAAASKAFSLFLNSGLDAKVLFLAEEDDPDSIACKMKDKTADFLSKLEKHNLLSCHIDAILARYSVKNVKDLGAALKGQVAEEVSALLVTVKNPVEREELFAQAAFKLMIEKSIFENLAKSKEKATLKVANQTAEIDQDQAENYSLTDKNPVKKIRLVNQLPKLDQEILRIVMAKRDEMTEKVLKEPDLCLSLQPESLYFIEELAQTLSRFSQNSQEMKDAIKILLKEYGDSWIQLWRQAHEMSEDARVDFEVSFLQCMQQVKKDKLNQVLNRLNEMYKTVHEEEVKLELTQQKLDLIRQINAIQV